MDSGISGGVYQIVNAVTGERYVGRAAVFAERFAKHKSRLLSGKHSSPHLQSSYNKHGLGSFAFSPLIECSPSAAVLVEQLWLDHGVGEYNVSRSAFTPVRFGDKRPAEVMAKGAAKRRGRKQSPETRAKISVSLLGNTYRAGIPHAHETCARMAAAQRGRKHTPETKAKMSVSAHARWRRADGSFAASK